VTVKVPVTVRVGTQAPALHAWSVPHEVPSGLEVRVVQTGVPVVHS
jgi:hypothetical protein